MAGIVNLEYAVFQQQVIKERKKQNNIIIPKFNFENKIKKNPSIYLVILLIIF